MRCSYSNQQSVGVNERVTTVQPWQCLACTQVGSILTSFAETAANARRLSSEAGESRILRLDEIGCCQ